jgi:hypothetical protein
LNTTGAVLIPMIADSFGAHGTELMDQVLREHKYDFGIEPKVIGVVFMFWDGQQNQVTQSNEIIKKWPSGTVFKAKIRENKWYRITNGRREAVWNTPAHKNVETELKNLVDEFVSKA